MKKTLSILAIAIFGLGLVSCENDSNVEDTEALFDIEQNATDEDDNEDGGRGDE